MPASVVVPEDKIIAKVTFGFWTNLFSVAFDVNRHPQALWPALLRPVFPNAPRGHRDRGAMQAKLLRIKAFRNRAFHHEPVWKIGQPTSVPSAITKLLETNDLIMDMIGWISTDSLELVEKAGYASLIRRVCSQEYLEYLKNPGVNDKSVSRARRELNRIIRRGNSTTDVTLNGHTVGKIIAER